MATRMRATSASPCASTRAGGRAQLLANIVGDVAVRRVLDQLDQLRGVRLHEVLAVARLGVLEAFPHRHERALAVDEVLHRLLHRPERARADRSRLVTKLELAAVRIADD